MGIKTEVAPGGLWRVETLRADLKAGLVMALAALPHTLPLGILVFAPMGPDYLTLGVLAGFWASVVGGLVAALAGGAPLQVGGPRSSVSLILTSVVAWLMAQPGLAGKPEWVLGFTFLTLFLAGMIQVGFGVLRLGAAIKYIPYPVIAGFMNGVAVLIVLGQLPTMLGLPLGTSWRVLIEAPAWQPLTATAALLTLAAIWAAQRWPQRLRLPPLVVGLLAGSVVFHLLAVAVPGAALGPETGPLPAALPLPQELAVWAGLPWQGEAWRILGHLLPSALLLATVGAIDALLSAVAIDSAANSQHDANRELIGQGLSNMASALFGGIASTGSPARGLANLQAGARTRLASASHAVWLLLFLLFLGDVLAHVPLAVLAAVMCMQSVGMLDSWSRQLVWKFASTPIHRKETGANLLVVAVVTGVTVTVGLMPAVGLGVVLSMLLFVTRMSKPMVRKVQDGRTRRSLRLRSPERMDWLAHEGSAIAVLELDGPLFFGTADRLRQTVAELPEAARYVILDCKRVDEMDSTGVHILAQMQKRLQGQGRTLLLAHMDPASQNGLFLTHMGMTDGGRWFSDTDSALEWAEDRVLAQRWLVAEDWAELPLAKMPMLDGLNGEQGQILAGFLTRRGFEAGQPLFREGDPGDSLFLIAQGLVSVRITLDRGRTRRVAAFGPGQVVGEMALLEGKPRSAVALADEPVLAWELTVPAAVKLGQQRPDILNALLLNLARELARRLRNTTTELRMAEQ